MNAAGPWVDRVLDAMFDGSPSGQPPRAIGGTKGSHLFVSGFPGAPSPFAGVGAGAQLLTMELNSSLVLLPKTTMKQRYFDPRVGYFARSYTDFDANPQGVKDISTIVRWKLEPKDEDIEKYKNDASRWLNHRGTSKNTKLTC